jgi:ABC-type antimicrobial peptide transport system permease subunit
MRINVIPVIGKRILDKRNNETYTVTSAQDMVSCVCFTAIDSEGNSVNLTITPMNQKHWQVIC